MALIKVLHFLTMPEILVLATATRSEAIMRFYMNYLSMTSCSAIGKTLYQIIEETVARVSEESYSGPATEFDSVAVSDVGKACSRLQLFERREYEIHQKRVDKNPHLHALLVQALLFKQTVWSFTVETTRDHPMVGKLPTPLYHKFPFGDNSLEIELDANRINLQEPIPVATPFEVKVMIPWIGWFTRRLSPHKGRQFIEMLKGGSFRISGTRASHLILNSITFNNLRAKQTFRLKILTSFYPI